MSKQNRESPKTMDLKVAILEFDYHTFLERHLLSIMYFGIYIPAVKIADIAYEAKHNSS